MSTVVTELDVGELYRANATDLVRYATVLVGPSDAQDVVSDAMASALSTVWTDIANPRAYLFRTVLNQAISHQRSASRRRRREDRVHNLDRPRDAEAATSIDAHRALASLSAQQRAVVYLTYWEDLTTAQVAETLEVSEGTVKKQLARARDHLRRILDA